MINFNKVQIILHKINVNVNFLACVKAQLTQDANKKGLICLKASMWIY